MCTSKGKRFTALIMALVLAVFITPLQVGASSYFDDNRIYVRTLVIVIDTQGVGEDVIWQSFERLRQIYHAAGETFIIEDGDWLYFTEVPFRLASPLDPNGPIEDLFDFVNNFFPQITSEFNWQRVWIYEDNFQLEPRLFGPAGTNRTMLPDEIGMVVRRNPYEVNFVLNGFNTSPWGQTGLHGELHWMECMMNCIDLPATDLFYQTYGESHCVLEHYLNMIGVEIDEFYRINTDFWNDAGIKAYRYSKLTAEQQITYNAYLLQKMREEFDLLPYLYRYYNYSPE